jgi:DNA-binding NarL/FixJ family response regulator
MNTNRPKLVIADDHLLVAQALSRVLEDEFDLAEIVADGQALVEAVQRIRPDLVVTDIRMPKLNGLDAIYAIRRLPDPPPIVVLTMYGSAAVAREALLAGASGFVLKQAADTELAEALLLARSGRCFVSPLLDVPATPASGSGGTRAVGAPQPTPRQCEVLKLIARGCRMKEIAARLQISRRTVESHKYQLMATLSAHSTAELVQHALRLGLIDLSGMPHPEPPAHQGTSFETLPLPSRGGAPFDRTVPASMLKLRRSGSGGGRAGDEDPSQRVVAG